MNGKARPENSLQRAITVVVAFAAGCLLALLVAIQPFPAQGRGLVYGGSLLVTLAGVNIFVQSKVLRRFLISEKEASRTPDRAAAERLLLYLLINAGLILIIMTVLCFVAGLH